MLIQFVKIKRITVQSHMLDCAENNDTKQGKVKFFKVKYNSQKHSIIP